MGNEKARRFFSFSNRKKTGLRKRDVPQRVTGAVKNESNSHLRPIFIFGFAGVFPWFSRIFGVVSGEK